MPGLDPSLCPSGLVRDGAWNIDRSTHKHKYLDSLFVWMSICISVFLFVMVG